MWIESCPEGLYCISFVFLSVLDYDAETQGDTVFPDYDESFTSIFPYVFGF